QLNKEKKLQRDLTAQDLATASSRNDQSHVILENSESLEETRQKADAGKAKTSELEDTGKVDN
ncbi:14737_t:CDS:2, partial [Acaulospora morrowiae]